MLVATASAWPAPHAFRKPSEEIEQAWVELSRLEAVYPGFGTWFWGKVAPGLETGERRLLTRHGAFGLDGVVVAKRGKRERKLCTVWVAPGARRRGLASGMIDEACEWLDEDRPLISVPEERIAELGPLLRARGFVATAALDSYYRPGKTEFVFNGTLTRRPDA